MIESCRRHNVADVEHVREQDGTRRLNKRILLADSVFTKLECSLMVRIRDIY